MTSISKLYRLKRQIIFPAPGASESVAPVPPSLVHSDKLLVEGQGTYIFSYRAQGSDAPMASVSVRTTGNREVFQVEISPQGTRLLVNDQPVASSLRGLEAYAYAYYWVSIDAPNGLISVGIGEARLETRVLAYQLPAGGPAAGASPPLLKEATQVHSGNGVVRMRLLRDPIVAKVPLAVRGAAHLTMNDVGQNLRLPAAALPAAGRQLYDTIAGEAFELNTDDFPAFARAIQLSIETPGCWCYQKLQEKQAEFGDPQEVYLRITLGQNGGESPGIPYVMEIWPPQCYSPVHQHAGANAIIRVLHGSIQVTLFPYLRPKVLGVAGAVPDAAFAFAQQLFEQGDITWISPVLNQVHQLHNPEPAGGQPCVTIQCYQYDADDHGHYAFFDYDDEHGHLEQFRPNSDADFVVFKEQMRFEWEHRRLLTSRGYRSVKDQPFGQRLAMGQFFYDPTSNRLLLFQRDRNLVLYDLTDPAALTVVWTANTNAKSKWDEKSQDLCYLEITREAFRIHDGRAGEMAAPLAYTVQASADDLRFDVDLTGSIFRLTSTQKTFLESPASQAKHGSPDLDGLIATNGL